jgi:hypothetical protein
MTDIRAFFQPAASASAAASADTQRGRPAAGPGSRGGSSARVSRDVKSRVRRRTQKSDDEAFVESDESDADSPTPSRKRKKVKEARTNWSLPENQHRLEHALRLVQRGVSSRQASRQADVPFSVLQPRVKGTLTIESQVGRSKALSTDVEKELVVYLLDMADIGFGKDVNDICRLARRLSGDPDFKATTQWWTRLKKRFPELRRRRAQGFERLRASAMNPGLIKHYFLILESAFAKIKELSGGMQLTADRIYNMDEIGFIMNGIKAYIVTRKGTKHVASISNSCRVTTSLAVAVSASGFVVPPFFIVKGQRTPAGYLNAAPPHSAMAMAKKGMMTEAVFEQWVRHFVERMEKRDEKHWSLLLLDGHHSHTMNPEVLKLLWDNRVYVVSLPSHTTAALQLLDVAVFGPMKRAFKEFVHEWKEMNPMEMMDKRMLPNIINGIWNKISVKGIEKGAASTGLFPLNTNWVAQNTNKMKISQAFSQPSLPGSISFANYTSSHRSLAALDLMLSPDQTKTLMQRIHSMGKLPKLNALGESASASRFLNAETRVRNLFKLHDIKMAELASKQEKRKATRVKQDAKRVAKLQKQHAKDAALEKERPLMAKMVQHGFQTARDGKPTVVLMRRFAQKQGIRVSGTRQEVLATLLDAIETALPSRRWLDVGDEAEQKSESEDEEPGSEASSESEESDPEEWEDVRVIYSMS